MRVGLTFLKLCSISTSKNLPTFSGRISSMKAGYWLYTIEEVFRSSAIHDDDLRLMMTPSLFCDKRSNGRKMILTPSVQQGDLGTIFGEILILISYDDEAI